MTKNELLNAKTDKIKHIFSHHNALIKHYGDLTVVEWKNSNGSFVNAMTLIYKGKTVYISGDLGNAVFNLTWNAEIGSFKGKSINYLLEKLSAINIQDDIYVFDEKVAKDYLMEEFLVDRQIDFPDEFYNLSVEEADDYLNKQREHFEHYYTDDNIRLFYKLWDNAYECDGDQKEWVKGINALVDDLIDYDEALDLYNIGEVYSARVLLYVVALQIIDENVKKYKKVFDWDQFKCGKIAVHCTTIFEAKNFLLEAAKHNIKWFARPADNDIVPDKYTAWEEFKADTCYYTVCVKDIDGNIKLQGICNSLKMSCECLNYSIVEWAKYMEVE